MNIAKRPASFYPLTCFSFCGCPAEFHADESEAFGFFCILKSLSPCPELQEKKTRIFFPYLSGSHGVLRLKKITIIAISKNIFTGHQFTPVFKFSFSLQFQNRCTRFQEEKNKIIYLGYLFIIINIYNLKKRRKKI